MPQIRFIQDSLNSAAGVSTSSSTTAVSSDVAELKDMVRALILDKKNQSQAPATPSDGNFYVVNIQEYGSQAAAVTKTRECQLRPLDIENPIFDLPVFLLCKTIRTTKTEGSISTKIGGTILTKIGVIISIKDKFTNPRLITTPFQASTLQAPVPPALGVSKSDFDNYVKANDADMQNMQNQMANITDLITKFVNSNTVSASGSGSIPSNTIANSKGDVKAITTRSGVSYNGP
ncbi:hypothetical protein Tco_0990919 [Tanacetum coccineum]|uniref:Reverse transcriptase domain-containing protein n=1 Tax=Tanacetum coccineum TaxID=301880 RepID=A0ABQ5EY43_9ASTR